jgi:heme-degrading monooxygenase HmoA
MSERIQHIVLFQFPKDLSDGEEREMFAKVRRWPDEIGGFTRLRFGRDVSGRSRGYQYALLVEFEDKAAADNYFPHPVHRAFADWVHERGSQEIVSDYALDGDAVIV